MENVRAFMWGGPSRPLLSSALLRSHCATVTGVGSNWMQWRVAKSMKSFRSLFSRVIPFPTQSWMPYLCMSVCRWASYVVLYSGPHKLCPPQGKTAGTDLQRRLSLADVGLSDDSKSTPVLRDSPVLPIPSILLTCSTCFNPTGSSPMKMNRD